MAQLPLDSHWATASQSFGAAAEAGAARTPRETAAAPPSTTAPRRSARAGMRAEEDERMGDSRSAACEVSCRVRRSEEHTSELQSRQYLVCRLLLEKKKI